MHFLSNLTPGQIVCGLVVIGAILLFVKGAKTPPRGGDGSQNGNGGNGGYGNNQQNSGYNNQQNSGYNNNNQNNGYNNQNGQNGGY